MIEDPILRRTAIYVAEYLKARLPSTMYFHGTHHTHMVVRAVRIIGKAGGYSEQELLVPILAAFFHDTGYAMRYLGHEEASAEMALGFLQKEGLAEHVVQYIARLILSTRFPQYPTDEMEMILCDADLYHLSLPGYLDCALMLKKEWAHHLGQAYSDQEWNAKNLQMLTTHQYFTDYGKQVLQQAKQGNIDRLIALIP